MSSVLACRPTSQFLLQLARNIDHYSPAEAACLSAAALEVLATQLSHELDVQNTCRRAPPVLARLWDAVAPGGHLVIQDYDLRTASVLPDLATFDEVGRVIFEAFGAAGADISAGRASRGSSSRPALARRTASTSPGAHCLWSARRRAPHVAFNRARPGRTPGAPRCWFAPRTGCRHVTGRAA